MEKKKEAKTKEKLEVASAKKDERVFSDLEGNKMSVEKPKKEREKNILEEHFRKHKNKYRLILLIISITLICIFGYIGIRNYIINKKYKIYEDKMDAYGFTIMYNNGTPKSSERVTRIEMIKIVLSSIYNTNEVESIGFGPQGIFDGDEWAKTAEAFGVIDEEYITKDTYNEVATYKETLIAYLKARSNLMDMPVSSTKESSFKNLQSYSQEERSYINDAVENGLLDDSKKNLDINTKMFKGEFNKLVVNFVEKYNTLAPESDALVTKEESKPSNASIYPYILYSVDKEAYEYKGVNEGGVDYKTPKETYKYDKDYYPQMEYRTEYYYNAILNIDYRTLNKDEYFEKVNRYLRYDYEDAIYKYIEYVKEHKIILEGKATVQLPIFYLDGISFRARVKLEFEIKNSDTDKNILLGDATRDDEVTYENKKYVVYIDAPMGTSALSKALMLDMEPIIDLMVNDREASSLNKF